MKTPEWKRIHETAWDIQHGPLRIYITRNHVSYRGIWIMKCEPALIDLADLDCETEEEAKLKAILKVRELVANLSKAANELPGG